jgi:hypothetical protein
LDYVSARLACLLADARAPYTTIIDSDAVESYSVNCADLKLQLAGA